MTAESTSSILLRGKLEHRRGENEQELTGSSYAGGQSEIMMGKAIKKYGWKRNDLVISTKVRPHPHQTPSLLNNSIKVHTPFHTRNKPVLAH
jgi:hypothetical protein